MHRSSELRNPGSSVVAPVSLVAPLGIAVSVLAVCVALVLLVWWNQERLVFQPPRDRPPQVIAEGVRRVSYTADDGQPLHGYLAGRLRPGWPVVIAFHGNADLAEWLVPWAVELNARTGAAVLLPEYRGYGVLAGRSTYRTGSIDARAALAYVRATLPPASAPLVLFGHSLGSAIAAEAAVEEPPSALILQSPFTSARAMAARMLSPAVSPLWNLVSRVHYDTRVRVACLDVPVHVAHGRRDRIIPVAMGRAVHAAAKHRGQLLLVSDAGHNDVPERGRLSYWRWLEIAVASAVPFGNISD